MFPARRPGGLVAGLVARRPGRPTGGPADGAPGGRLGRPEAQEVFPGDGKGPRRR